VEGFEIEKLMYGEDDDPYVFLARCSTRFVKAAVHQRF